MAERIIHFNALSAEARQDLVDSFALQKSPVPTLRQEEPYLVTIGWLIALLVCAAGGALFLAWYDLGELYGDLATQSWYWIGAYMLAFALVGVAIGYSVRRILLQRALPYWPGLYLYGVDLIDARTSQLKLIPMATLKHFNGVHHHTNGAYTHTAFSFTFEGGTAVTFTINGKDQAEAVLQTIRDDGRALSLAASQGDVDAFIARDPLFKARTEPGWNEMTDRAPAPKSGPVARDLPGIVDKLWQPLAAAGIVVAVPFWLGRELVSDHFRWAQADAEDSSSVWETYLRGGWWQSAARDDRLPAAAFREAKERGTVSDMRAFIEQYPDSKQVPEARAAIHEIFTSSLAEFKSLAADDPKAVAFMEALVAWLEKNDSPPVDVRFLPPSATALSDMDTELEKEVAQFAAGLAKVAPHFSPDVVAKREDDIVGNLQKGFAHVFPHDVMTVQKGPPLTGEGAMAPDRPGIRVQYDVRPSGSMYEDEQTHRAFVGIAVLFDVEMTAPGAEPIDLELTVQPPSHFSVETYTYGDLPTGGPSDGAVYDQMAARAYDALVEGIERAFFKTLPEEPIQVPSAPSPGFQLPDNLGLDSEALEELRKQIEAMNAGS